MCTRSDGLTYLGQGRIDPTKKVPIFMSTADMAMREDPEYRKISQHFRDNPQEFQRRSHEYMESVADQLRAGWAAAATNANEWVLDSGATYHLVNNENVKQ